MKGVCIVVIVVGGCFVSFVLLLVVISLCFCGEFYYKINWRRVMKYLVFVFVFGFNVCLNLIIYGWRNLNFRSVFFVILRCV